MPRHSGSSSSPVSPHAAAIASNDAADGQRRRGQHRRRLLEQPAAQQACHRQRRHPQRRRRDGFRGSSSWSSHTTSVRSGIAGTNDARMRVAVSLMSVSAVTASARAARPCGSTGDGVDRRPRPAARRRAARSGRWPSRRRGGRCGPASRRGSPTRTSPSRPRAVARVRVRRAGRRAASPRRATVADSSAVATPVTRSTSSCASSTTSSSCSGSTAASAMASMASSAWLVTTTSACAGLVARLLREAVGAERAAGRADAFPRRDADLAHDRSGTPGVSSSRSPVSVSDDHAVSRCTSRPSAVRLPASNSSSCGRSSGSRQPSRCESCSGTGSFRGP